MKKCPYRKRFIFEHEEHLNEPETIEVIVEKFEECLVEDCMAYNCGCTLVKQ